MSLRDVRLLNLGIQMDLAEPGVIILTHISTKRQAIIADLPATKTPLTLDHVHAALVTLDAFVGLGVNEDGPL